MNNQLSTTAAAAAADRCTDAVKSALGGRPCVLTGQRVDGLVAAARRLRELGVPKPLAITAAGSVPEDAHDEAVWFCAGVSASEPDGSIRQLSALLDTPPPGLSAMLDRFDPERRALVLDSPLAGSPSAAGRRRYGWRPAAWAQWEDKVVAEAIWPAAALPAPPTIVARAGTPELPDMARKLDEGTGTVWAGDASAGFTSAGAGLRWVRNSYDARAAQAFFALRCQQVRVTPFIEGLPCSVHGIVLRDGVAVLRPLEIVTLRAAGPCGLRFAGTSTFWDPVPWREAEIRAAAQRVGAALAATPDGYRGAFTLDGVLTGDGFRPTEINARFGSGLDANVTVLEVALYLLDRVIREADEGDLRADELEAAVLGALHANRVGRAELPLAPGAPAVATIGLCVEADGCRVAARGAHVLLRERSSPLGRRLEIIANPDAFPRGATLGRRAVRVISWCNDELGLGLERCSAAPCDG